MSMDKVMLSQVLSDFKISMDGDDFASNVSDIQLRNIALRGIREFGFDLSKGVKSLKMSVNKTNNTVALPDDFVSLNKLGIVGSDGLLYAFNENKNINFSRKYKSLNTSNDFNLGPLDIPENSVNDTEESKTPTEPETNHGSDYYEFVFDNYIEFLSMFQDMCPNFWSVGCIGDPDKFLFSNTIEHEVIMSTSIFIETGRIMSIIDAQLAHIICCDCL